MVKVNFSSVSDNNLIPEGVYDATFTEFKLIPESKASGQPYFRLTFTLQDEEYQGRKAYVNHSFTPEALWAFKRTLVRLGAEVDVLNDPDTEVDEVMSGLIGAPCRLVIINTTWQGKPVFQVQEVKEASTTLFG